MPPGPFGARLGNQSVSYIRARISHLTLHMLFLLQEFCYDSVESKHHCYKSSTTARYKGNSYWMRLSMIWRIMQTEEGVLLAEVDNSLRDLKHNSARHVIRKPNSIIISLFIRNISKFLTSLPPRRLTEIFCYLSVQFLSEIQLFRLGIAVYAISGFLHTLTSVTTLVSVTTLAGLTRLVTVTSESFRSKFTANL